VLLKGHAGLTLLILSPILFTLDLIDFKWVMMLIFAVGFSWLPDIDLCFKGMHRTSTHSVLFAVTVGVVFGFLLNYAGMWVVGFLSAFVGTICHLLGDILTPTTFEPFTPFLHVKVGYELFKSEDTLNNALMILGSLAFMLYLARYAVTL